VVVHGISVEIDKIVSVDVIDIAVSIVVHAREAVGLGGIGPDVVDEVAMRIIDAGIEDSDDDFAGV
jgi:hypothetical protein